MPARPAQLDAPFPVRERETGDGLRRCGDTGGPAGGDAHARAGAAGTRSGPQPAEAPVSAGTLSARPATSSTARTDLVGHVHPAPALDGEGRPLARRLGAAG